MDDSGSRTPLLASLAVLLVLAGGAAVARSAGWFARPAPGPSAADRVAATTYDGPMVRRRAAMVINVAAGVDSGVVAAELQAAASAAGLGELDPVPVTVAAADLTFLAPERVSVPAAQAMLRDGKPPGVESALVEPVLTHDLTFAVFPAGGISPAVARARADAGGVLTTVLGRYATTVQRHGMTVRYAGALLGDDRIEAARQALGRAAGVPAARVQVTANQPGAGVELDETVHRHR